MCAPNAQSSSSSHTLCSSCASQIPPGNSIAQLVRSHRDELERLPSAFFSVSLAAHDDREVAQGYVVKFVVDTGWHPGMVGLFAGALRYTQYGFIKRRLMRKIARDKGTLDTDTTHDYVYTDWDSVTHFTDEFLRASDPHQSEAASHM